MAQPAAKPPATLKSDLIIKETRELAGRVAAVEREVKSLSGYVNHSTSNIVAAVEAVHHRIVAREHIKAPAAKQPAKPEFERIIEKLDVINAKVDTTRHQMNALVSRVEAIEQKLDVAPSP